MIQELTAVCHCGWLAKYVYSCVYIYIDNIHDIQGMYIYIACVQAALKDKKKPKMTPANNYAVGISLVLRQYTR